MNEKLKPFVEKIRYNKAVHLNKSSYLEMDKANISLVLTDNDVNVTVIKEENGETDSLGCYDFWEENYVVELCNKYSKQKPTVKLTVSLDVVTDREIEDTIIAVRRGIISQLDMNRIVAPHNVKINC